MIKWLKKHNDIVLVFLAVAILSFIIWPIEKSYEGRCESANVTDCRERFTSVPGGGAIYLLNVDAAEPIESDVPAMQNFYIPNQQASYTFAPLVSLAMAIFIGLGAAVVVRIFQRASERTVTKN